MRVCYDGRMDFLGQSALIMGLTSFALGASLLARNVRNKLFITFAVLTTLVAGWAVAFFLEKVWPYGTFYRLHLLFNIWLAPGALVFIRQLVRIGDRSSRILQDLSIVIAIGMTIALGLQMEQIDWVLQCIYFAPVFVLLQILQLMWIDMRLRKGGVTRASKRPVVGLGRRNLIYVGGLLALATSVMDHVPFMGPVIPALGNVLLAVYLFFLSQAISQQRLLNLAALFSRFLVLLAVAFTLTIIYSMLVGWIENSPVLFFFNSFIASFLILTLLDPLRALVRYFTERLLTPQHRRLRQVLVEGQRNLAGIVDMASLFQEIILTTERTLQPDWIGLYVLRADGTKYRRMRENHPADIPTPVELLATHPLLEHCRRLRRKNELPILLDQMLESEMDRSASRVQRDQLASLISGLRALGANLLIPIFDDNQILAFVAILAPAPPDPWGSNWGLLPIIFPYYEAAAQSMRSMEVYVKSREKERLATLGEMAAGLAHEIRNPLGAIKGAAQFLDPTTDRPESKFLKVIVEETDRLNRVVSQFLEYSKPPKTDLKPMEISPLVERIVESARPGVGPSVTLEFIPSAVPFRVRISPEQIHQVLLNLIQNSLRALDKRKDPRIRVFIEPEGAAEVAIVVEDNGMGIRRENLEKLFIPFFTTSPSGTGLGLSISQKIIEAHGGRIEVSTEEGRFSRFSVILPVTGTQDPEG